MGCWTRGLGSWWGLAIVSLLIFVLMLEFYRSQSWEDLRKLDETWFRHKALYSGWFTVWKWAHALKKALKKFVVLWGGFCSTMLTVLDIMHRVLLKWYDMPSDVESIAMLCLNVLVWDHGSLGFDHARDRYSLNPAICFEKKLLTVRLKKYCTDCFRI